MQQQPAAIDLDTFGHLMAAGALLPLADLPHCGAVVTRTQDERAARTDVITRILAEGASAGIHLVMTGDRTLLAGRIAAMCEDKLVFKLAERDDYASGSARRSPSEHSSTRCVPRARHLRCPEWRRPSVHPRASARCPG